MISSNNVFHFEFFFCLVLGVAQMYFYRFEVLLFLLSLLFNVDKVIAIVKILSFVQYERTLSVLRLRPVCDGNDT